MQRGLFITGTDTNVGKTVASAALMHRYRAVVQLCYWKPIQTGIEQDNDTETVRRLGACSVDEIFDAGVRLPRPLSPHLSARLAGEKIELDPLIKLLDQRSKQRRLIVEGAGGALVPLNEKELMIDLMTRLGLPVVVAARSSLGTINHTLLTIEALRKRQLTVAGIVMIGEPNAENRRAIEWYGSVDVIGEMPRFETLDSSSLQRWSSTGLDAKKMLEKFLL